jgi:hypothetical protein
MSKYVEEELPSGDPAPEVLEDRIWVEYGQTGSLNAPFLLSIVFTLVLHSTYSGVTPFSLEALLVRLLLTPR